MKREQSAKTRTEISQAARKAILQFVDSWVPDGAESVWLTGSRVRGDARPDSDWDVIVFHPHGPRDPKDLFLKANQISPFKVDGGVIEVFVAHPDLWNDPRRYLAECRETGIRLR